MPTPILATKLYVPPPIPNLVPRPRLIERLNDGISKRLILISAPAGFGKSTLLSSWAAQHATPARIAWLSLDERDNDLARFISYFIAALQIIEADIGAGILTTLQGHAELNYEIILTNLLNEISTVSDDLILILDDYHVIESRAIDQSITFLLDHLPVQFHLVISSRIDPTLPLPRLFARGHMLEVRADDLRFSASEAADFLNQVMGFELMSADLTALEERTEGWIAGLQLAALSMRAHQDIHEFIRSFTGSNRYILDYLGEEVLFHQSPQIQDFLLQTSILNRLHANLCDELIFGKTAHPDIASQEILEYLEANNLFIVSLDDQRHWYRYHNLFVELLQHRLKRQLPGRVEDLHARASRWHESNGYHHEAIFHAFQAGDITRAAELIEASAIVTMLAGEVHTVNNWLSQLPEELIKAKPGLCLAQGWQSYINGQTDKAILWLDTLETNLGFPAGSKLDELDVTNLPHQEIWEALATIRSTIFAWQGKAQPSIEFARWALDKINTQNQNYRCILEWNLAFSSRLVGNLNASEKAYLRAIEFGKSAGNPVTILNATVGLAQLYEVLGQLRIAENTYLRVFELGKQYQIPNSVALGSAHIGLANVLCQTNRLDAAMEHFQQGFQIAEKWGVLDLAKAYVCHHRIQLALGDLPDALEAIEKAISLSEELDQDFRGGVARVLRTRLWLLQGEFDKAIHWSQSEYKYDPLDLSELNEIRGITQARVLLALGDITGCLDLSDVLLLNAEKTQRLENAIEIRIIKALAFEQKHDSNQALIEIDRAQKLAEPHGFMRIFLDGGPDVASLITKALHALPSGTERRVSSAYLHHLLSAFSANPPGQDQPLAEELSPREREILQLIAIGLSNREISERLFLAINTIKGYNRTIFGKLGVQNRTEAANRARELGIG